MWKQLDIYMEKHELQLSLTADIKINSRWTVYLNITAKTIILIEENMGGYLCNTGVDNSFLDKIIKTLAIKMV